MGLHDTIVKTCSQIVTNKMQEYQTTQKNNEVDTATLLGTITEAIESDIDQSFIEMVLKDAGKDFDAKIRIKENQQRMNELAEYKYKKTLAYKNIIKRIVYSCIVIIAITYMMKLPIFPGLLGKGLIIIIISFNLYYLLVDLAWNFRRDNKYWDKFDQFASETLDADGNLTLSKFEHNKKSLEKIVPKVSTDCEADIEKIKNQLSIQMSE